MSFLGIVIAIMAACYLTHRGRQRSHDGDGSDSAPDCHRQVTDRGGRHQAWNRRRNAWRARRDRWRPEPWGRDGDRAADPASPEEAAQRRARLRAAAETGFFVHFLTWAGVIGFLFFVNMLTSPRYPWFLWPALGWGLFLFFHWAGVFGTRLLRERFLDPAVDREVRREKVAMTSQKQASLDELSSTIAHEIRNPIAAAKSLVQQMEEDPQSVENVEYARVALEELDRVERRIAHLLKYAKEEDYAMAPVNLAMVVDGALTQLRGKLDAARVAAVRNYITGPTVVADAEKLRQVFANLLDNAIDAFDGIPENRRIELFIEGDGGMARARVQDNGCGIASEKIGRVFSPFFTTKEQGTGLGMAIAKKIVEAHAGAIDVRSEPGCGTEFVVSLPLPR